MLRKFHFIQSLFKRKRRYLWRSLVFLRRSRKMKSKSLLKREFGGIKRISKFRRRKVNSLLNLKIGNLKRKMKKRRNRLWSRKIDRVKQKFNHRYLFSPKNNKIISCLSNQKKKILKLSILLLEWWNSRRTNLKIKATKLHRL